LADGGGGGEVRQLETCGASLGRRPNGHRHRRSRQLRILLTRIRLFAIKLTDAWENYANLRIPPLPMELSRLLHGHGALWALPVAALMLPSDRPSVRPAGLRHRRDPGI
jgi:hypothetical protein